MMPRKGLPRCMCGYSNKWKFVERRSPRSKAVWLICLRCLRCIQSRSVAALEMARLDERRRAEQQRDADRINRKHDARERAREERRKEEGTTGR